MPPMNIRMQYKAILLLILPLAVMLVGCGGSGEPNPDIESSTGLERLTARAKETVGYATPAPIPVPTHVPPTLTSVEAIMVVKNKLSSLPLKTLNDDSNCLVFKYGWGDPRWVWRASYDGDHLWTVTAEKDSVADHWIVSERLLMATMKKSSYTTSIQPTITDEANEQSGEKKWGGYTVEEVEAAVWSAGLARQRNRHCRF